MSNTNSGATPYCEPDPDGTAYELCADGTCYPVGTCPPAQAGGRRRKSRKGRKTSRKAKKASRKGSRKGRKGSRKSRKGSRKSRKGSRRN